MKVKTKKQNPDGVVRLETSGEIKEVRINEDFLDSKKVSIALCFRGKNGSGIVELTPEELKFISEQVSQKMKLLGDVKVMKFKK